MNQNFAAAMRRATEHTRANDLTEATRIIQQALSGRPTASADRAAPTGPTGMVPTAPKATQAPFKADPNAEIIEPVGETSFSASERTPRSRMPLAETLRTLREGKAAFGGLDVSRTFTPLGERQGKATVDIPAGAVFETRTFSCAAGTRTYRLYRPASAKAGATGLIVMLHGCKQNPDDFAAGTRMNAMAEEDGLIIAYPGQTSAQNPSSCWNWFRPGDQMRGRGEPAIIAGMTEELAEEFGLDRERTFVAGLSAGGAMAAIMGETYPDLFAAIGVHSGLAHGSATDVVSAFAAMRGDATRSASHARHPVRTTSPVRTIVFQGLADPTVHASNAERIMLSVGPEAHGRTETTRGRSSDGRSFECKVVADRHGRSVAECWLIDGAVHAWSGGDAKGTYADPKGPDASREMVRFFLGAKL